MVHDFFQMHDKLRGLSKELIY